MCTLITAISELGTTSCETPLRITLDCALDVSAQCCSAVAKKVNRALGNITDV